MTLTRRITGQNGMTPTPDAECCPALCVVRLIDRRTGAMHRLNGRPMLVLTRKPQDAAAELIWGRDPAVWEARIDPVEQPTR